jgi:hypothetical protein
VALFARPGGASTRGPHLRGVGKVSSRSLCPQVDVAGSSRKGDWAEGPATGGGEEGHARPVHPNGEAISADPGS